MAQYHLIQNIPGVQVAAPIAMVGYALLAAPISLPIPAANYAKPGRQLYRISTTWVSGAGTSRITQPASLLYVTPNPLRFVISKGGISTEVLPSHASVAVCPAQQVTPKQDPFGIPRSQTLSAGPRSTGRVSTCPHRI
jgi:putative ABC transport system permease protein